MADEKCRLNALCNSVAAARKELAKLRKDVRGIKEMFVKRFNEIEAMLKRREVEKYAENSSIINTARDSVKENSLKVTTGSSSFDSVAELTLTKSCSSGNTVVLTNQLVNSCVIGHIRTCFKEKNGIPRQGSVCPLSKAVLCIDGVKKFTNPIHALEGLENFSHIWLLFLFHKNSNNSIKAKVQPPRLNGKKVGVFSSRSPHRPSPIGLTLAHLDGIKGNALFLSGIDILDGTPILDIKPYIPDYDSVHSTNCTYEKCFEKGTPRNCGREASGDVFKEENMFATKVNVTEGRVAALPQEQLVVNQPHSADEKHHKKEVNNDLSCAVISDWIRCPAVTPLSVSYSDKALENLGKFFNKNDLTGSENRHHGSYQLELLANTKDVQKIIEDILKEDPRSIYRRNHCPDELYHFTIDRVNVSCIFSGIHVQVIDINPV